MPLGKMLPAAMIFANAVATQICLGVSVTTFGTLVVVVATLNCCAGVLLKSPLVLERDRRATLGAFALRLLGRWGRARRACLALAAVRTGERLRGETAARGARDAEHFVVAHNSVSCRTEKL